MRDSVKETRKSTRKRSSKKLNETVSEVSVNNNLGDKQKCRYCNNMFDIGNSVCPKCRRRNGNSYMGLFFVIIALVMLFAIIVFHFVEKFVINDTGYDAYTSSCVLVTYEDMVRIPKSYLYKDVAIIGSVNEVSGEDNGYSNNMNIVLDMNLFDDGSINLVDVYFEDKDYEQGFLDGDIVKVYGEYVNINGNRPYINARYVEIVK